MLEVMAGDDGYDPRIKAPAPQPYSQLIEGGANGLKIGVVKEGFGWPNSEPGVDAKVRAAARLFESLGTRCTRCRSRCTCRAARSGRRSVPKD